MCTVVCRWSPGAELRMLAVRDEFVGREFDGPGAWWADHPGVIGGRDRKAGGTWCASDVRTGVTAVVLNRPEKREAAPGAASRGVLPLLAVEHGAAWPDRLDIAPMASFNLMLATPESLTWWSFDGSTLVREDLGAGDHVAKPRGLVPGPLEPRLADPGSWSRVLAESRPSPDPSGLLVRIEHNGYVYATVFAQLITSSPGSLIIDYTFEPQTAGTFRRALWRHVEDGVVRAEPESR